MKDQDPFAGPSGSPGFDQSFIVHKARVRLEVLFAACIDVLILW